MVIVVSGGSGFSFKRHHCSPPPPSPHPPEKKVLLNCTFFLILVDRTLKTSLLRKPKTIQNDDSPSPPPLPHHPANLSVDRPGSPINATGYVRYLSLLPLLVLSSTCSSRPPPRRRMLVLPGPLATELIALNRRLTKAVRTVCQGTTSFFGVGWVGLADFFSVQPLSPRVCLRLFVTVESRWQGEDFVCKGARARWKGSIVSRLTDGLVH